MSDSSDSGAARPLVNWAQTAGLIVTVASLSIAGVTYLNRVDAKADYALQQIGEVKAVQRQMVSDSRDDLKTLNGKVDQLLLLTGRLQQQTNRP